jgi:hypothetical protein
MTRALRRSFKRPALNSTREGQLTRDERRVIEMYLLKEAAHKLHQRLHAAATWRDGASEQLHSRPMSSGMRLRFAWEPRGDGPSGLREAIKLLRRHSATWSEKESCPACPKSAQPDQEKLMIKAELETLLGDDEDGLAATYADHGL